MDRQKYLDLLTNQIRCEKARLAVRSEIESHIEDQKNAFIAEGMEASEAEQEAIREMGDPVDVGISMDRIHRPQMAWGMIFLIGLMSLLGFLLQYRQYTDMADGLREVYSFNPVTSFGVMMVGFLLMIGVCYADYSRIAGKAKVLTTTLAQ